MATRSCGRRPASSPPPRPTRRSSPAWSTRIARLYGIQFHPEVVHTPRGRDILRNFVLDIAGAEPDVDAGQLHRVDGCRDPRAGRRARAGDRLGRARHLRAVGRRRLGGCRGARPSGRRRSADVHLRRSRPDAQARVGAAARDVRAEPGHAPRHGRRARALPGPPGRRRGAGAEAQASSATSSSASSRRRRRKLGRIDFLTQGTLYPDVIEIDDARDQGRAEDQDAPQRRRAAGRPALPADRAVALPVQGRGPRGRPGARPAGGDGHAPAVPGPGPRHPDHRRGHAPSGSIRCARPTGSSSTRSRPPASTAACGRASRS